MARETCPTNKKNLECQPAGKLFEEDSSMTATDRMPFAGVIDADGHILEPPDLWERYLEPKYRERAIRIKVDEHGLEYLELDGKKSKLSAHGTLGFLG